jgi:hypothetical protein
MAARAQAQEIWSGVTSRIDRRIGLIRRTTQGPVMVRASAGVGAATALLVSLPSATVQAPAVLGLVVLCAVGVALFPRTRWTTVVALLAVIAWVYSTLLDGDQLALWRVVVLAAGLYLAHTGAALAAVLPHDAIVSPEVLTRWVLRTGAVLGVSLVMGLGALVVAERLRVVSTLFAPILGLAAVAALAAVLAWQWRRR